MKRLILFSLTILVGLFVTSSLNDATAVAQTRYYAARGVYDADGVKHAGGKGMYLTFTNNMVYESDRNGNAPMFGPVRYQYIGTRDGKKVYRAYTSVMGITQWYDNYYYFSSDYSRLNWKLYSTTYVYDLSSPEDEIQAPDTFY